MGACVSVLKIKLMDVLVSRKTTVYFSLAFLNLALFFIVFSLLKNKEFYDATVGLLELDKPKYDFLHRFLTDFKHSNLKSWDSAHYYEIGTKGYTTSFQYAFFPLYPMLIKVLPDLLAHSFLNYFLYTVGLFFILKSKKDFQWSLFNTAALFTAPFIFVVLIPYSEALMFFCFGLGWFLRSKEKQWVYPFFFLLAGMIRASNVFMIACLGLAGLVVLLVHRDKFKEIVKQFDWVVYIGIGVLLGALVQYLMGAPHLLFFVEAQKYWNKKFMLPTSIFDWSQESLGLNVFMLLVFFPFLLSKFKSWYLQMRDRFSLENSVQWALLIYLIGLTLLIYTTQMGSMNGLFRYVCCTPFFFLILNKKNNQLSLVLLLCFSAFLFYNNHNNIRGVFGCSEIGFFIFIAFFLFMFFDWTTHSKWTGFLKWFFLLIVYITNLFFTSVCLYKFLSHSYIIT